MNRSKITELHYITPIKNFPSIMDLGILSHDLANLVEHASVANEEVQSIRVGIILPTGRKLHDHVNLYFDARNAMMYVRRHQHRQLAVLRVSPAVLILAGVMVADGNAASRNATRFDSPDVGIARLDRERVYCDDWRHENMYVREERKRQRCAEVLVSNRIPSEHIFGAITSNEATRRVLLSHECGILVTVSEHMFFYGPRR